MANPKKVKAELSDLISYGEQVYKLVFQLEKKLPKSKAGQFLHLTLDDFDPTTGYWPESRVFSIASCSDDRMRVTIVYSVKGFYTKRMEERLKIGSSVWLKAPYGEFIISNYLADDETAVLIAGGTGVSPFIPFLNNIPERVKVQLNYGLRNSELMIFEDEIQNAVDISKIDLALYIEKNNKPINWNNSVTVYDGVLSIKNILSDVKNIESSKYFISGPPLMIDLFMKQLIDSGISKEKIIIDEWG
jgi:NAD(P)H-flavin reductase